MIRYLNYGGNSGIYAYEIGEDYIDVQFSSKKIYRYSYKSAGSIHVENMKILAEKGNGLNSYIMRNVRKSYESIR